MNDSRARPPRSFEIGKARSTDLDRLIAIHSASFPDPRVANERRVNFVDNPRGPLSDLFVVRAKDGAFGGEIVGHGFLFDMKTWIAGNVVPFGGVASIGVASEARGCGVARALVGGLLAESRRRGHAMQLLYPFAQRFYSAFGFGPTSPVVRLRVAPSALPHRELAGLCARATDADRAAIVAGYAAAAAAENGHLARTDALFAKMLARDGIFTFVVRGEAGGSGPARGYVSFRFETRAATGETELNVRELVASDDEARRALIGLLAAQRDQVSAVELSLSIDDPLPLLVSEAHAPGASYVPQHLHPIGAIAAGPMVRAVDLQSLLQARGYRGDGSMVLRVTDGERSKSATPIAGERLEEVVRLEVRGGVGAASLVAPRDAIAAEEELAMDLETMSAIAVSALRPSDAAKHGRVRGSAAAIACADRMFDAGRAFRCLDEF